MIRIPAKRYRARARTIIEQMLMNLRAIAGPGKGRDPTEKEMEDFIDELPYILNWTIEESYQTGIAFFHKPLTEHEMQFVESRLLRDIVVIKNDNGPSMIIQL